MLPTVSQIRWQYQIFSGLLGLTMTFTMSTYILYLRKLGLTDLECNLMNTMFFGMNLLLDAFTGALADKWGRKRAFVISALFWSGGAFTYSVAHTVRMCLLAEFIAAIGRTMANGALSSWMNGNLQILGAPEEFANKLNSIAAAQKACMGLIGSVIGYKLYLINAPLPWKVSSCAFMCLAILAALWLHNDLDHKRNAHYNVVQILTHASIQLRGHGNLRNVAILTMALAFAVQAPNMQWPKYYEPIAQDGLWLGLIGGAIQVTLAIGSLLVGKHAKPQFILWANRFTALGIIAMAAAGSTRLSLVPFYTHEIFRGAIDTLKKSYIQKEAAPELRTTVTSLDSTVGHVGAIIGLVFSGYLVTAHGFRITWFMSGSVLLLVSLAIRKRH